MRIKAEATRRASQQASQPAMSAETVYATHVLQSVSKPNLSERNESVDAYKTLVNHAS